MSDCEICGRAGAETKILIEGSRLAVCKLCAGFGQNLKADAPAIRPSAINSLPYSCQRSNIIKKPARLPEELKFEPRADIGLLVKKGREKLGLTQGQLALKMKMPANFIRRVEGGWVPSMDALKKLEAVANVSLVEGTGSTLELRKKVEKQKLTLGDVADVRT